VQHDRQSELGSARARRERERSEREGGKSKSKKIGLCRVFFQMFARVALRAASEAGVARLGTSDEPLNAV